MNNPAITLLEQALDQALLDSQAERYLDSVRNSEDGWYRQSLSEGTDMNTVEQRLYKFFKGRLAFGASIAPIARGMLALAQGDPDSNIVKRLPANSDMLFPTARSLYGDGESVVAFNPSVPGCGHSQPAGSSVFGRGGTLRLQAVVLTFGRNYHGDVQLALVFPYPSDIPGDSKYGYSAVTINTEGGTRGHAVSLNLYANQTLQYSLGTVKMEEMFAESYMGSGINAALTFPGADEYLAKHIGDLGAYFEAAAAALSGMHTH